MLSESKEPGRARPETNLEGEAIVRAPDLPFGALPISKESTSFRVFAAGHSRVEVVHREASGETVFPLSTAGDGTFHGLLPLPPGSRYGFMIDGRGPYPDPLSRSQPDGVTGLSCVTDPAAYRWKNRFQGLCNPCPVVLEVNIPTFSPEGTFRGAIAKLPEVAASGIEALQIMPVWECPGAYNWGYDQTFPFAPHHSVGTLEELKELIDAAHGHGIAVILDVVYNHLGPDAGHFDAVSPEMFSKRFNTWWGAAFDWDSPVVRRIFVEHALYCVNELNVDALRLDATHAMHDDSETRGGRHILAEIVAEVKAASARPALIIAEDPREEPKLLASQADGGYGIDKQYRDEFHHLFRAYAEGLSHGYFAPFAGAGIERIVEEINLIGGSPGRREIFLCNHDQIGNVAPFLPPSTGVAPAEMRAWTALASFLPAALMLFQGQTWSSSAPFYYFRDGVSPEMAEMVRNGRRNEFKDFFDEVDSIPDPMERGTFESSKVRWEESSSPAHAAARRFHEDLLALRRAIIAEGPDVPVTAEPAGGEAIIARRALPDGGEISLVVNLRGAADIGLPPPAEGWERKIMFSTESPDYASPGGESAVSADQSSVRFDGPGAVILRLAPALLRETLQNPS